MSTAFDEASVILPQGGGYKAGKLYGWRPDVKQLQDIEVVQNTANGSRVNEQGLIEFVPANTPRWDWSEGGSCPSLSVEPQRTNLLTRSEEFDNADWSKNGATITGDDIISPDGTLTADKITANATTSSGVGLARVINSASRSYSVFVKKGNLKFIRLVSENSVDGTTFNLDTQSVVELGLTHVSANVEIFSDGWLRLSIITNSDVSNSEVRIRFIKDDGSFGSVTGDFYYIWGAQLEEGSFATSYIKTEASTATRNADVISKTGIASLIGQSEGTLYFEASWFNPMVVSAISLSDGTTNNRITIYSNDNFVNQDIVVGGVSQGSGSGGSLSADSYTKIAARYKINDYKLYQNGSSIITDTSALTYTGELTTFRMSLGSSSIPFFGRIRALAWFKNALNDSELAALTTP